MTQLDKLHAKRAATLARIERLQADQTRVAEKLAGAQRLITVLEEQIAAATETPAATSE